MDHLRVALLGGSFNPIHNGHLKMAMTMLEAFNFDQVWFVLAKAAPLKDQAAVSFEDRKAMIELMIQDDPRLKLCEIEAELPSPSYTIHTIEALQARYDHEFAFVIGSDQAQQFHLWKNYKRLLELVKFYEVSRDDEGENHSDFIKVPALSNTSSTMIRHGLSNDTHPKVCRYFIMHHLYDETILKHHLQSKRYEHSVRVKERALSLAQGLDLDQDQVWVAALYHDLAKEWDIAFAQSYLSDKLKKSEPIAPYNVHAYGAALYLKHFYHIDDQAIFDAIAHHVNGTDEKLLSKLIYIADKIEPGRKYNTQPLYDLARHDIEAGFKEVKYQNEQYLKIQGDG